MSEQQDDVDVTRALSTASELRVLLGRMKRRLREEAHLGDFTPSQMAVLSRLDRDGPATVTSLARAEGVRPQSMGANISVLEAAGMVNGAPDPGDKRQTILSLTAACREMIDAGRAAREDWLFRVIRANLTSVEQDQLATGIALLQRLLDS